MANGTFLQELKKRNVFKVASIYAVTAWLIIQVAAVAFPVFELPLWTQRIVIILALIGFPVALLLAWAQERKSKLSKETSKKKRWVFPLTVAGIGLLSLIVWRWGNAIGIGDLLSSEIREEKVGIVIFDNKTSDKNLDALGYLASEFITSSLRQLDIKTVAPEVMREYKDFASVASNNPEGKPSYLELTKAKYLVTGIYFDHGQENDSIRLTTRLLDAQTGEEIQPFPVLYGKKSKKEELIEEARQRLMGYWAIKKYQRIPVVDPPRYEAYQEYLTCYGGSYFPCHIRVLQLDSTFLLNRIDIMWTATWWHQPLEYKNSKKYVEAHWDQCTDYEKLFFQNAVHFWEGDNESVFEGLYRLYEEDPTNLTFLNQLGSQGVYFVPRPGLVLEAYEPIFDQYETYRSKLFGTLFEHYLEALNQLGQNQKLIKFCEGLPDQDFLKKANSPSHLILFKAYLENDQTEQALAWMEKVLTENNAGIEILVRASLAWNTFYQDTVPDPYQERLLKRQDELPDVYNMKEYSGLGVSLGLGETFSLLRESIPYWKKDWPIAERTYLKLREINPDSLFSGNYMLEYKERSFHAGVEAMLGMIYARQGKVALALQQLETLEAMKKDFPKTSFPGGKGYIAYRQAKIQALLGNKEQAVALLQEALDKGTWSARWRITFDWDLASLRGYEPYENLLRPKRI